MDSPTPAQREVMDSLPRPVKSRVWRRGPHGLSTSAREACIRKGWVEIQDYGSLPSYVLTELGSKILAENTHPSRSGETP